MMRFPRSVYRLLFSSFVFVLGRAVALPYMAIYLTRQLGIGQQQVGWIMGGSIFLASLFGLYAGYLADRISKRKLMAVACVVVALCSVLLSIAMHVLLAVLALTLIEAALILRGISLKAMLADLLPSEQRSRAFSLNYVLINVAFAVGPVLGVFSFGYAMSLPLWISALFAVLASQMVRAVPGSPLVRQHAEQGPPPLDFRATLSDLKNDRRLVFYTLGSVLTTFVFGRFVSGYLSQYLLQSHGAGYAAQLIPYVLMTNALAVILLQYPIGKLIRQQHLFAWIAAGAALYMAGLFGFMHASSVLAWVLATVVFTLGEVIVIPVEYLFIDMIAPPEKRGSYYGAQGLSTFGAALNPIVCGYLLAHFPSAVMFWTLIAAAMAGVVLYYAGTRHPSAAVAAVH